MRIGAGRRCRRSRGQALVEFALIAPIFFVVLLAIIECGRGVYYIQMVNNAAREAARYAIVHGGESACPSGPIIDIPNTCDATGANVVAAAKQHLAGVDVTSVAVMRCWNGNAVSASAPCDNGSGSYGPGFNQRGMPVYVRVTANFNTVLSTFLPIPAFQITGESTLVVNH